MECGAPSHRQQDGGQSPQITVRRRGQDMEDPEAGMFLGNNTGIRADRHDGLEDLLPWLGGGGSASLNEDYLISRGVKEGHSTGVKRLSWFQMDCTLRMTESGWSKGVNNCHLSWASSSRRYSPVDMHTGISNLLLPMLIKRSIFLAIVSHSDLPRQLFPSAVYCHPCLPLGKSCPPSMHSGFWLVA